METFRRLVDRARKRQNLSTKTALAGLLGINVRRLSDYEAGARKCPVSRVSQLAELAGADVSKAVGDYELEWHRTRGGTDTD